MIRHVPAPDLKRLVLELICCNQADALLCQPRNKLLSGTGICMGRGQNPTSVKGHQSFGLHMGHG